jgi:ATP dependent DNA ligase domain
MAFKRSGVRLPLAPPLMDCNLTGILVHLPRRANRLPGRNHRGTTAVIFKSHLAVLEGSRGSFLYGCPTPEVPIRPFAPVALISPGLGIIEPCLPSSAKAPPSGPGWLHEIKHDGFRMLARRDSAGVRLITRHGNDFMSRFPLAVAAAMALPAYSFLIDGEAIVTNERGLAVFDLIRHQRHGADAVLLAFDLIELDGEDLHRLCLGDHVAADRGAGTGAVLDVERLVQGVAQLLGDIAREDVGRTTRPERCDDLDGPRWVVVGPSGRSADRTRQSKERDGARQIREHSSLLRGYLPA